MSTRCTYEPLPASWGRPRRWHDSTAKAEIEVVPERHGHLATIGGTNVMSSTRVLVTGAGGFIGHHLVTELKNQGFWVRGVDIKHPEYTVTDADEFLLLDLTNPAACQTATAGIQEVYALAADMGGMGYISTHHSRILRTNSFSTCIRSTQPLTTGLNATSTPHLPACTRVSPGSARGHAASGGGCLPRATAGRVRMGEADL